MPAFPQVVTFWSSTPDGMGGYTYGSPTAVRAFYAAKNQVIEDNQGRSITSNSIVYVDSDVSSEGYIFLGTSTASDPTTVSGASRILRYDVNYSLNGEARLRKVYL